jgi:hypothetical protein
VTNTGNGAAPEGNRTRGEADGEVSGPGVLGRLGKGTPIERPPGVRREDGSQSTRKRGQEERDKVESMLRIV